jgi:alpha-glucosidase
MDSASHPKDVVIHKQTVTKNKSLTLTLAPGGGCAIRFVPRRKR